NNSNINKPFFSNFFTVKKDLPFPGGAPPPLRTSLERITDGLSVVVSLWYVVVCLWYVFGMFLVWWGCVLLHASAATYRLETAKTPLQGLQQRRGVLTRLAGYRSKGRHRLPGQRR
ncbi:MAG: hypothetical protein ACPH3H_05190, partial [Pseudomonadales bacterium]